MKEMKEGDGREQPSPSKRDVEGAYWRAFSVTTIGHIRVDFVKVVRVLLEDQIRRSGIRRNPKHEKKEEHENAKERKIEKEFSSAFANFVFS
jgi:hypothetical protein